MNKTILIPSKMPQIIDNNPPRRIIKINFEDFFKLKK